jgi:drug/metabolite transporter (DMT)-like permease
MKEVPRAVAQRVDLVGFAIVIGSSFCYSALGIFAKAAYAAGLSLTSLLATRLTLGAAVLWGWVVAAPALRRAVVAVPRRRALGLLALGAFVFAGQSVLFFSALQRISASLTEVLLYTCPAFLALILWGVTGRRPDGSRLVAIVLALFGTYRCLHPGGGIVDVLGATLATSAGLCYAVFLLGLHRLTHGIPGVVSGAFVISGAGLAFDAAAFLGGSYHLPPSPAAWGSVIGMVLTATVLGFVLFIAGLKRVGPQVTAILSTFEPLGTLMLAAALLGERLTPVQWGGAALVIGAAFVLAAAAPSD